MHGGIVVKPAKRFARCEWVWAATTAGRLGNPNPNP